jgi:hypothetical protein
MAVVRDTHRRFRAQGRVLTALFLCAAGCRTQPSDERPFPQGSDLAPGGDLGAPLDLTAAADASLAADASTMMDLSAADLSTHSPKPDLAYLSVDGGIDDGGCGIILATGSSATAYQINPAHDGVQPGDRIAVPLCKRWTAALSGALSYPVVAGGRVFITAAETTGYGTGLYALDEQTGKVLWGPVALGGTYFWSGIGWDAGRVFAVNGDGLLRAFADDTGMPLWQASNASDGFTASDPVAVDGRVYVAGSSGFTVFDGATGMVAWSAMAATANHMTPAVAGSAIYMTGGCSVADAFDLTTHLPLWHGTASCMDTGGGGHAVYGAGALYARSFYSNTEVYDGATGKALNSMVTGPAPAITSTLGYFVHNGDLQAIPIGAQAPGWAFDSHGIVTPPIVAGNTVVVAGNSASLAGTLFVLDAATGSVFATVALPGAALGVDEWNYSTPVAGLAVADGMIFVPTGAGLIAY